MSPEEKARAVRTAQAANLFVAWLDKLPADWSLTDRRDPRPLQERQQEADEISAAMRELLEQNREANDVEPG